MKHLLPAFLLFLAACQSEPALNPNLLTGSWTGSEWLVADQPSGRNASAVHFVFEGNGNYIAAYGDQKEKGTFKLKGDKLYTTAEDKIEKMVKVLKLSADSLVFDMNRVGQKETLVLIKK